MKRTRNEQSGFINVKDTLLYYRSIGTGPPIVLLHGNGQSHEVFRIQEKHLMKNHQVILIDSRGNGASGIGKSKLTFSLMAEDLLKVLDYLHLEKVILLGYSDGGNTALQAAIQHSERLLAIIVISGNTQPKGLKAVIRYLLNIQSWFLKTLEHLNFNVFRQTQLNQLMLEQPRISNESLHKITTPALIISGEHDIVSHKHTLDIGNTIPNSQVVFVKGASHFTILERWREYSKQVEAFLADQILGAAAK